MPVSLLVANLRASFLSALCPLMFVRSTTSFLLKLSHRRKIEFPDDVLQVFDREAQAGLTKIGIKKRDDIDVVMNMLTKKERALEGFATLSEQRQAQDAFVASFKTVSVQEGLFWM